MGSSLHSLQAALKGVSMPYKSEKQRKFMHANKPKIADQWDSKYGSTIQRAAKRRLKNQKR